uniref:Phage-related protein n=1 Tax=Candidatus Kentrum sp. FM TaxID=2126340 RepID=A0A450W363_9GAMM|nr:MAG: Phage-related protein [Candidatus Kentron sp. FM]VFJ61246.1 MAG: Phage-related protein [Candidatus Kentron sp. FM]VFK11445.1 MAG: Phage-related protein [Candidatus Kentron sp. FM]
MPTKPILTVNFFRTNSGNEPVRDWLKDVGREDRKRVGGDIKLVQFRWPLGLPPVRKMEADLWEIRTNLGSGNIARVFFTVRNTRTVLLHGFVKKSQKTPRQELDLARTRRNQWLSEDRNS